MKLYLLIPQQNNNYCLCSVLQGIFRENGIVVSQDHIAMNLTPREKGFMIDDAKIKSFLQRKGFDYSFYWWDKTPLNEPFSLINEIVQNKGFLALENHTYKIRGFKDPEIITDDPKDSSRKMFNYISLMRELQKKDGGFGLIKRLK